MERGSDDQDNASKNRNNCLQGEGKSMQTAWKHLKKYMPLLIELVRRDLKIKYRRSFLGYVWSLLSPLLMMTVMTIAFSYMFRFNISNFPLYLITGQTLWTFFSESTSLCMFSVLQNGALIKKVYILKFIFPISRVVSSYVTMSFSLGAIVLVMLFTRAQFFWTIIFVPVPLMFLFLFCMGIGMILSALAVYFRDVTHLYGVLTLAWMYLTPIFYPVESLPVEIVPLIMNNPMYAYIAFFRDLVLYGIFPEWSLICQCAIYSVIACVIGMMVFRRLQKNFVLYI